jgi:hypothetical protein
LFEPGEFSAMKNFDLLLNFCILFRAKNQRKTKKNGQGLLAPFMPGSAGGNQKFHFSVSDDALYHIRWKILVPGMLRNFIR